MTDTSSHRDNEASAHSGRVDLVIITGMSGAGRTEAMHTFEDLGYYCIDNLPPTLLPSLVDSSDIPGQSTGKPHLAVVCDARNRDYFAQLDEVLRKMRDQGIEYRIIFLDASDEVLLARYKASRRRHPLCTDNKTTIAQGIDKERTLLSELREIANLIIDTTSMKPIDLHECISDVFSESAPQGGLGVVVYSFGFKHGMAEDADIVIDVRFLPNPYYDPEMRYMTGLDDPVRTFVMERPETVAFISKWQALLDCVMPGYVKEGKQQLAIAVGCTGGQHRSVVLAEATGEYLKSLDYRVHVTHRDLSHADQKRKD
ncbi:MAG: RNase adapter RapZ [Eggerthellaceae bacterium]|nr:RNase adapter RapZ [Eggerthellaceae bacterium]